MARREAPRGFPRAYNLECRQRLIPAVNGMSFFPRGVSSVGGILLRRIILPSIPVFLTSCSGTVGTLAWRSWDDEGIRVTEIRSAGLELRNLPGYTGATLGVRRSIYGAELKGSQPTPPGDTPWRYGWCPGPEAMPVHLTASSAGMDTGWEPSFRGVSVGVSSRSVTALPADSSQVLHVTVDTNHPENSRIRLESP